MGKLQHLDAAPKWEAENFRTKGTPGFVKFSMVQRFHEAQSLALITLLTAGFADRTWVLWSCFNELKLYIIWMVTVLITTFSFSKSVETTHFSGSHYNSWTVSVFCTIKAMNRNHSNVLYVLCLLTESWAVAQLLGIIVYTLQWKHCDRERFGHHLLKSRGRAWSQYPSHILAIVQMKNNNF